MIWLGIQSSNCGGCQLMWSSWAAGRRAISCSAGRGACGGMDLGQMLERPWDSQFFGCLSCDLWMLFHFLAWTAVYCGDSMIAWLAVVLIYVINLSTGLLSFVLWHLFWDLVAFQRFGQPLFMFARARLSWSPAIKLGQRHADRSCSSSLWSSKPREAQNQVPGILVADDILITAEDISMIISLCVIIIIISSSSSSHDRIPFCFILPHTLGLFSGSGGAGDDPEDRWRRALAVSTIKRIVRQKPNMPWEHFFEGTHHVQMEVNVVFFGWACLEGPTRRPLVVFPVVAAINMTRFMTSICFLNSMFGPRIFKYHGLPGVFSRKNGWFPKGPRRCNANMGHPIKHCFCPRLSWMSLVWFNHS